MLRTCLLLTVLVAARAADLSATYEFKPIRIGGGGWVTGVVCHPTAPGVVYCRTDVGGAYRWDAAAGRWHQLISAARLPANLMAMTGGEPGVRRTTLYNVDAIAVDASDPQKVYLAAGGDDGDAAAAGFVLKSVDGGASFTWLQNAAFRFSGNADHRTNGERLQVDPRNGQVLWLGTRRDGLQRSLDGGASWQQASAVPLGLAAANGTHAGISALAIDGTSALVAGRSGRIYAASAGAGVWTSPDGGGAWSKVSGGSGQPGDGGEVAGMEVVGGRLLVAWADGTGIWRYTPATGWTDVTPQAGLSYEIAVDPGYADRIYAVNSAGTNGLWRSVNGGGQWTRLSTDASSDAGRSHFRSTQAPWKTAPGCDLRNWLSVGQFAFDPTTPGRMWFAEGMGMWRSDDLGDANNAPDFDDVSLGIEEMVCNQVQDLPGGKALVATWDRPGFVSADPDVAPGGTTITQKFSSLWAVGTSPDRNFVALAVSDHRYINNPASGFSTTGGTSWTAFASHPENAPPTPADLKFGEIVVSATSNDRILWLPRSTDNKVMVTINRGGNWNQASGLSGYSAPNGYFMGSRRGLVSDRVQQRFGLYDWNDGGVFISGDGAAWTKQTGTGLPAWVWHCHLVAAPGKAGHWWFSTGFEASAATNQRGVWRSTNGGISFARVPGFDESWAIGFGKASPAASYPAIYVYGRRAGAWGLWRSTDEAATWDTCVDYPLGLFDRVNSVCGDMEVFGRVMIGYSGNSAVVGNLRSVVDSTPPATPAAPTASSATSASPTLSGTTEANVTVKIYDNGMLIGTVTANGAGAWTWTVSPSLAAGSHALTVTATDAAGNSSGVSPATTVTVAAGNLAPTIATAASASPATVSGTTTVLSVLGADDAGEAALTYTWATTGTPPSTVAFNRNGTNAAKAVTATFNAAGTYTLRVTIRDAGGQTTTNTALVTVIQTLTAITLSPRDAATLAPGASRPFSATAVDQFGAVMATAPAMTWSVVSGGTGMVDTTGVYTASAAGSATVRASYGAVAGSALVTVATSTGGGSASSASSRGGGGCGLGATLGLILLLGMLLMRDTKWTAS